MTAGSSWLQAWMQACRGAEVRATVEGEPAARWLQPLDCRAISEFTEFIISGSLLSSACLLQALVQAFACFNAPTKARVSNNGVGFYRPQASQRQPTV